MNWTSVITLLISFGTLIVVIVEVVINLNQRKIDRRIDVTIEERRRMQKELFENVNGILEIDREVRYKKLLKEEDVLFHEVLNYKIGVWINLNRENIFSEDLRSHCNRLATWIASCLEELSDDNKVDQYLEIANTSTQHIWILIDKYIEEEERLIQTIVAGKKEKR